MPFGMKELSRDHKEWRYKLMENLKLTSVLTTTLVLLTIQELTKLPKKLSIHMASVLRLLD
jgi:hypothetical protein